jgi:predicted nucleic acid-binding protein
MVDSSVFVALERGGGQADLSAYDAYGETYLSAVTASELLVGTHYADTDTRRARRTAFVGRLLAEARVLAFTKEVARVHAWLFASLQRAGRLIGAHDLIIAAMAIFHDLPLLTGNVGEFKRVDGLVVLDWTGGT